MKQIGKSIDKLLKELGILSLEKQEELQKSIQEFLHTRGINEPFELKLSGKTLFIFLENPVARQEVFFQKEDLKSFLESKLKGFKIETIQIKAGGKQNDITT